MVVQEREWAAIPELFGVSAGQRFDQLSQVGCRPSAGRARESNSLIYSRQ